VDDRVGMLCRNVDQPLVVLAVTYEIEKVEIYYMSA
jgi:hypothetical protein